jgi:putative ABC transport system permease protein
VALVSEAYWRRTGADPAMLGRTLRLESGPVTVVGVVGSGTLFPPGNSRPELWLPMRDDFMYADRDPRVVQGVWARLPRGLDLAAAQERADVLAEGIGESQPDERTWRVRIVHIGEYRGGPQVRRALWALSGTVGMIFLIALVNGVNLVLVHATARTQEVAVRRAIGASRARLLRQLFAEAMTLGALAGAAAAGLAWGAVVGIRGILPLDILFWSPHTFEMEARTLALIFAASLVAGMVLGLVPALRLLRSGGTSALPGSRPGEESRGQRRLRAGLVVAQVALSTALLVGAGLFVNSFIRLVRVDAGFEYERVALADLMASPTRYPDGPARWELAGRLERALEARPEIESVAVTTGGGFNSGGTVEAEGRSLREDQPVLVPREVVSPDYFRTMGVEVVAGRPLQASDVGTDNVMVDRDMARFLFDGERSAIGRRFRVGEDSPWRTIVGVVDELRLMGRDQRRGPYQSLYPSEPGESYGYLEFAMRTAGPPEALLPIFEETLRSVDAEQAYWRLRTGADALAEEEETARFLVTLMSLLAAIAVTLAAVGLYGVLSYAVARRHHEIGIRMALGAARRRVQGMVLWEGLMLGVVGAVLGLVGARWLGRAIEDLLYEVGPGDPLTLAATTVLLLAVAATASLLPARKATRVNPVEALRAE